MAVLVTGGAGFVGMNVLEALLERGEQVVSLDAGEPPPAARKALAPHARALEVETGSVLDREYVDDLFRRRSIERVIHAAAVTSGPQREARDPASIVDVNVRGTLNVLQSARKNDVRRVVYVGSGAAYGETLSAVSSRTPASGCATQWPKLMRRSSNGYAILRNLPRMCFTRRDHERRRGELLEHASVAELARLDMKKTLVLITLLGVLPATIVRAQDVYPQRPLRLVLSVPPGGAADFIGRVVGAKLSEFLAQNVVIESRPGAGGIVASVYVTNATPDGHTLYLSSSTTHGVAPVLYKKLPYDPIKSFSHISLIAVIPAIMAVHADVPAKTVKEFIALAKAKPGAYRFSSSGNGSAPQLIGEQFKIVTGTELIHVPYKGSGPAVVGLVAGEAHVMWDGLPSLIGQIKAGRLRPLAAMYEKRFAIFPEVPTAAEAGLAGAEGGIWYGLSGPAGMPRPIVERLNQEVARLVAQPDVQERFASVGGIGSPTSPRGYIDFILKDNKKWAEVVRISGATVE